MIVRLLGIPFEQHQAWPQEWETLQTIHRDAVHDTRRYRVEAHVIGQRDNRVVQINIRCKAERYRSRLPNLLWMLQQLAKHQTPRSAPICCPTCGR